MKLNVSAARISLEFYVNSSHYSRYGQFTTTLTERAALEMELERIRQQDYAVDAEEFVDGLVCVAVPVRQPGTSGTGGVRCAVALQAPVARMPLAQALQQLPRLREAATALARTLV